MVQSTKNKEEVAPFLMPLGAARVARSADWLKIDMWETQASTEADRDSWSVRYGALCRSALNCTSSIHLRFESRLSLLCMHIVGHD